MNDSTVYLKDHQEKTHLVGQLNRESSLEEALAVLLQAEDSGRVPDLSEWLAFHPENALELADFLALHRNLFEMNKTFDTWTNQPCSSKTQIHIPGFEIQDEIGRGGMGVVYRAFDQSLKRTVALKCILIGEMASQRDLLRFRFEAEAAAGLDHYAITPVYSFGENNGQPYLIMKMMDGGSLAKRLKENGTYHLIPYQDSARLVRDIALGVHHAHLHGLLHRDLKPANILLDHDGRPHVADFGLAIALKSSFSKSQSGSMAGTAAYMAPEQISGESALSTAVDIHALGAILYELVTGIPPYGNEEWLITIQRVRDENPYDMRQYCPNLPRDLETIILRCLQKQPADRYDSAQSLAEDLTRFINDQPLLSQSKNWLRKIGHAVSHRRQTMSMSSWPAFFMSATSLIISQMIVTAILMTGANPWLTYVALGTHYAIWMILYWIFLVSRSNLVSMVERSSMSLQLGMMIALLSLLPSHFYFHGSNILPLYPYMNAIFGIGIFAHGATHWGRLYVVGTYLMLIAIAMPLLPIQWWPMLHGIFHGAALLWLGYRHREFDIVAKNSMASQFSSRQSAE